MDRKEAMAIFQASPIYAITAEPLSQGRTDIEVAEQILESGIKLLQYREKHKSGKEMYADCQKLRELTQKHHAVFIVDDFVDLALAAGADGVHIGQDDLPPEAVRHLVGNRMLVGFSTHNARQLTASNALGDMIDYIGCGPVYPTQTKECPSPVTGLDYIRYASEHATHPFVAIGGIKAGNIADVRAAGAKTCALVSEIVGAADIPAMIAQLR